MPQRALNILLGVLSLAGLASGCLFLYNVIHYSTNAPIGYDDIELILADTIAILHANSFTEWLKPFLHQNAEHRPAMLRLLAIASYVTTGKISLVFINVFSACLLLGSLIALLRSASRSWKETLWMVGWAVPLMVAPLHHDCMLWASCSGSHYSVIAFGCIALVLAKRTGWLAFIAFEIACVLALFSLFSGLMVFFLGGLAIWLRSEPAENKRIFLGIHGIISLVCIGLYMVQLDLIYKYLPLEAAAVGENPAHYFRNGVAWILGWLGAWLDIGRVLPQPNILSVWTIETPWVVIAIGFVELVMILTVLWLSMRQLDRRYISVWLMLIYLCGTILVAATQRSIPLPMAYIFTPRYQIYTLWLVVCALLLLLFLLRDSKKLNGSSACDRDSKFKLFTAGLGLACLVFYAATYQRFHHHLEDTLTSHTGCIQEWSAKGKASCWYLDGAEPTLRKAIGSQVFQMD